MNSRAWRWGWIWLPLLALGLTRLAIGDPAGAGILLGQGAIAWSAGVVLAPSRRVVFWVCTALLWTLLGLVLAQRSVAPLIWYPQPESLQETVRSLWRGEVRGTAVRSWRLRGAADGATLSFDARLVDGAAGSAWERSDPRIELRSFDHDPGGVRASFPDRGDPYLMRTLDLGAPLGGERLRAHIEIRSDRPIAPGSCHGLWLQVWGPGGGRGCADAAVGADWTVQEVAWEVPAEASSSVIRLIVNNLDGHTVEIRNVTLERWHEQGWQDLGPLLPSVPSVRLGWTELPPRAQGVRIEPTERWQRFTIEADPPPSAEEAVKVVAAFEIPLGVTVQFRNTRLTAFRSGSPVRTHGSTPPSGRQRLWFAHPNLAGHTVLALVGAAVASSAGMSAALLALLPGLGLGLASGSRAALVGMLLVTVLVLALTRRSRAFLLAALLIGLGPLALLLLGVIGRSVVVNPTTRPEIWHLAGRAFTTHPWRGVGMSSGDFASYWGANYRGTSSEPVTHAHNLWLAFSVGAGVPGLVASLWITFALLRLAFRSRERRGLIALLPVLAVNIADYTLFFTWVLLPTIAVLNALTSDSSPLPGRQERPPTLTSTDNDREGDNGPVSVTPPRES